MRRRAALALCAALGCAGAGAAELPSRAEKTKPPDQRARTCFIGGERGIETPGGGCVRISGYVSFGVTSGDLRR